MPHILFVGVETTSGVKFEIREKLLSCGWLISYGWKNFSFMHFMQTSSGTWKQAMDWLVHIFFVNCATQASFVQKNGWWNISSFRYSSACLYALKCTNWLPLAFKPLNFRVLKCKRKTLSITFVLAQARRNHTFMNCQVKSILIFFLFFHLTMWYFFKCKIIPVSYWVSATSEG